MIVHQTSFIIFYVANVQHVCQELSPATLACCCCFCNQAREWNLFTVESMVDRRLGLSFGPFLTMFTAVNGRLAT